jgi:hypothetical protein
VNAEAEQFRSWWPYVLAAAHHQAGHYNHTTHTLQVVLKKSARTEDIVDLVSLDAAIDIVTTLTYKEALEALASVKKGTPNARFQSALAILRDPVARAKKHVMLILEPGATSLSVFIFPTAMLANADGVTQVESHAAFAVAMPGAGKWST